MNDYISREKIWYIFENHCESGKIYVVKSNNKPQTLNLFESLKKVWIVTKLSVHCEYEIKIPFYHDILITRSQDVVHYTDEDFFKLMNWRNEKLRRKCKKYAKQYLDWHIDRKLKNHQLCISILNQ